MWNNKQYQTVADGLKDARDAIDAAASIGGEVWHAVAIDAWETTAEKVMASLRAHHRGDYAFSESRFRKAAGMDA